MTNDLRWVKAIFLIGSLVVIGFAQSGQSASKVHGIAVDLQDARVDGVRVTLKNFTTQRMMNTTTNDAGEFVFDAVESGSYELSAEFPRFDKYVERVVVEAGKETECKINLELSKCPDPVKRLSKEEKAKRHYCALHRKKMRLDIVRIEYGLVIMDISKESPNAHSVYYGGCVGDCYEKAEIFYCPICRKVESGLYKSLLPVSFIGTARATSLRTL